MSLESKRQYLEKIQLRYQTAGKEHKSKILDEFCSNCGHHRKHAIRLLKAKKDKKSRKPGPRRTYGKEVLDVVKRIWLATDQLCSKRLKVALKLWLPFERNIKTSLSAKLLHLSPATIDRLLKPIRARSGGKGLSGTKPGTLLKHQIPIRTSNEDIDRPGFFEADTVAHCGNSMAGNFIWSLTFTDIFSGWTECGAVWNKGSAGIQALITRIEENLPVEILGFDCDNGSEFLNYPLMEYFTKRAKPVGFTRSRPYKKNDNAHVEQKNWTHVRQLFGFSRLEDQRLVELMNELYREEWSLIQNFFCPSMKLKEKKRIGSKYVKKYDEPQTPCQRLLKAPQVPEEVKKGLREVWGRLNPFDLKAGIEKKLKEFFRRKKLSHLVG